MKKIHPTAIIDNNVELADGVEIGAYCVLNGNIKIGKNTIIASHVVISGLNGKVKIGKNNKIFQFASIGSEPQDNKYMGEESNVEIGDNNIIREYCTINGGSNVGNILVGTKNTTHIGDNCYLYISSHVAHDVYLENNVTLTNYVGIAGHVKIGHDTIVGGLSGVHQFVNIGHNVMIGGACAIGQDVPPFAMVMAKPTRIAGVNIVGMKRLKFSLNEIKIIDKFYKDIINNENKLTDVLAKYKQEKNKNIKDIINFIKHGNKRGLL